MNYRSKAYPHPVLTNSGNDYGSDSRFTCSIEAEISPEDDQRLELAYEVSQSSSWLDQELIDHRAHLVLDIQSRSTLTRRYEQVPGFKGLVALESGSMYGAVVVTPLLVASVDSDDFAPEGVHEEYRGATFAVRSGDLLGIGDSIEVNLGRVRAFEKDLITIRYSAEPDDEDIYRFELSGPRIVIIAGESLREAIGQMRADKDTRPYLYMSVFKDCISAALRFLAEEGPAADDLPWATTLRAKLDSIGRDLDPENAQAQELSAQLLMNDKGFSRVAIVDE